MGVACQKCADIELQKGVAADKPLDASSSEDEDDLSDEEDEDEDMDDGLEEEKHEVELALKDALKRGKTQTFKEAIAHANSLGLDEDKIRKAEQKLEEHKLLRRRELFEAELQEFLDNDSGHTLAACQEMLSKAKELGVSGKMMESLEKRVDELDMGRALETHEADRASEVVEALTRSFVQQCVSIKGRTVYWVDLSGDGGKKSKKKGTARLDTILKNFRVEVGGTEYHVRIGELTCMAALDAPEVTDVAVFADLGEADQKNAIALIGGDEPWCFVESETWGRDEFSIAMKVLNAPIGSKSKTKKRKKDKASPRPDKGDGGASPRSPRASKKEDKAEKKEKKSKKDGDDAEEDAAPAQRDPKRRMSAATKKLQSVAKTAGRMSMEKKNSKDPPDASEE